MATPTREQERATDRRAAVQDALQQVRRLLRTAAGTIAATSLAVSGNATVGGTLGVTGHTTLSTFSGAMTAGSVPASLVTAGTFGTGAYTFGSNGVVLTLGSGSNTATSMQIAGDRAEVGYNGTDAFLSGGLTKGLLLRVNDTTTALTITSAGAATFASTLAITGITTANDYIAFPVAGTSWSAGTRAIGASGTLASMFINATTGGSTFLTVQGSTVLQAAAGAVTVTGTHTSIGRGFVYPADSTIQNFRNTLGTVDSREWSHRIDTSTGAYSFRSVTDANTTVATAFTVTHLTGAVTFGFTVTASASTSSGQTASFTNTSNTASGEVLLATRTTDSAAFGASWIGRRSRTTGGAVVNDDVLSGLYGQGHDGTSFYNVNTGAIRILAAETHTTGPARGTKIDFATTTIGAATRTVRGTITDAGVLAWVGSATFGTSVVVGTDPGGSEPVRFTGAMRLTGNIIMQGGSASDRGLFQGNTNGVITISGSTTNILGGILKLYGSAHASQANDIEFRQTASTVGMYDHSALQWQWEVPTVITSTTANQLSVRYNSSGVHMTVDVASTGAVTFDASGASASFAFADAVALSPANANITISPTGTGLVTIAPATTGSLDNVTIGGTTARAGTFTTIAGTTVTATGLIQTTLTTEQLRLRYDASNFLSFTVLSSGSASITLSTAATTFSILGTGETLATFVDDGAVTLFHNNSSRLATSATGVTISGVLVVTSINASSNIEINTNGFAGIFANGSTTGSALAGLYIGRNSTTMVYGWEKQVQTTYAQALALRIQDDAGATIDTPVYIERAANGTIRFGGAQGASPGTLGNRQVIIDGAGFGAGVASLRLNGLTSGAAAAAGTLTNAPAAGDPAFWIPVSIAGTVRYIPAW